MFPVGILSSMFPIPSTGERTRPPSRLPKEVPRGNPFKGIDGVGCRVPFVLYLAWDVWLKLCNSDRPQETARQEGAQPLLDGLVTYGSTL